MDSVLVVAKRRGLLASAVCLVAGLTSGCGAQPRTGETVVLEGTLVLKGNEPVATVVLATRNSEFWELQNVPAATATRLQNKRVHATGVVTRASEIGPQLRALRVTRLDEP